MIHRRNFLLGLGAAFAAPAIVKAESLMKVKPQFSLRELWKRELLADTSLGPASILPGHITYIDRIGGRSGFWPLFELRPELFVFDPRYWRRT